MILNANFYQYVSNVARMCKCVVACALGQRMSNLTRGRGEQAYINPSPQAAISIKPRPSRALQHIMCDERRGWGGHSTLVNAHPTYFLKSPDPAMGP